MGTSIFKPNLFLLLSLFLLGSFGQEECDDAHPVYYVSKTGSNSMACYESATHLSVPCATLSYLVSYRMNCSNITVYLLDQEAELDQVLLFDSHTKKIAIIGNHSDGQMVAIHCAPNSGLYFKFASGIVLENLKFVGCSFNISGILNTSNLSSLRSTILLQNTLDTLILRCIFESKLGSAILLEDVHGFLISESFFWGNGSLVSENELRSGGMVVRYTSNYTFAGKIEIQNCSFNSCCNMINDTLLPILQHHSTYEGYGGAIQIFLSTSNRSISITISDCYFFENRAIGGGAVGVLFFSKLDLNSLNSVSFSRSNFSSNFGLYQGGAVLFASAEKYYGSNIDSVATSSMDFILDSCTFFNNTALWGGGVAAFINSCQYCNNSMKINLHSNTWESNFARLSGFAIAINGPDNWQYESEYQFKIIVFLTGNTVLSNNCNTIENEGVGAVAIDFVELIFYDGKTTFQQNQGTALLAKSISRVIFQSNVEFSRNLGVKGGAILIRDHSYMFFNFSSVLTFTSNEADVMGGAVYSTVSEKGFPCIFTFPNYTNSTPSIIFRDNKGSGMDQAIYIADANNCSSFGQFLRSGFQFFPNISNQLVYPPDRMEFNILTTSKAKILNVTLGQRFYFDPKNVNDIYGSKSIGIANIVNHNVTDSDIELIGPSTISVDNFTKNIEFYIQGKEIPLGTTKNISIDIYFKRESTYRQGCSSMSLTVVPCKLGYKYDREICRCASIASSEVKCHAGSKEFCVQYHYWYSIKDKTAYPCPIKNCDYLSGHCPRKSKACLNSKDFCSIEQSDDVCREGRTHVLCSLCSNDYSFTFGAYQCVQSSTCTNLNTSLLVLALLGYWVLFAMAILVVLSRNLSVGSGFMYGIVYYFSVVTIYTSNNHHFSTMWIEILINISTALTQLDPLLLGNFKCCFAQSWRNPLTHQLLRYATPFFVIILILAVIFISRHCRLPRRISFAENSPIHAICMLILFSYTSLSCTSFRFLVPTYVEGDFKVKDAPSVLYFHDKDHIPYAVLGLCIELFISLPMCFLFLLAPRISGYINLVKYKLKPILDEFQACYRPECRWFAGFYFLSRQLVYLINGLFSDQFPQFNSILTIYNAFVLLIHVSFQPYRNIWLNRLDTFLLLDIMLLSLFINDGVQKGEVLYTTEVFFHNNILPNCLILLPTLYLFCAISLIFLNKWIFLKICPCFPKFNDRVQKLWHSKWAANNSIAKEPKGSMLKLDDSFYEDSRLREELLDDCPIHNGSDQSRVNYGTLTTKPFSTTSVRVLKSTKTV